MLVLGGDANLTVAFRRVDLLALASGFFYAMQNVAWRKADAVPAGTKSEAVFFGGGVLAALLMLRSRAGAAPGRADPGHAGCCLRRVDGDCHVDHHVRRDARQAGRSGVLLVAELVVAAISAMLMPASGWKAGMARRGADPGGLPWRKRAERTAPAAHTWLPERPAVSAAAPASPGLMRATRGRRYPALAYTWAASVDGRAARNSAGVLLAAHAMVIAAYLIEAATTPCSRAPSTTGLQVS